MKGTIVRVLGDKYFGFIRSLEDGKEYFFHQSGIRTPGVEFNQRLVGKSVEFEDTISAKGPRAEEIYVD